MQFGPWTIQKAEIFAQTAASFAFVNLKPIVPGHVLVAPKRPTPRVADLTSEEVGDLFCLAQCVGAKLEKHFCAEALTLTIQDGPAAGQTVPHVHVHVLPRCAGDFEPNDVVYAAIDEASKAHSRTSKTLNLDVPRIPRTTEQMALEAAELRKLFTEL